MYLVGQHTDGHREVLTDPHARYYKLVDLVEEASKEQKKNGFVRFLVMDGDNPLLTFKFGEDWKGTD